MKKIFTLISVLAASYALWAGNVITYTAPSKLPEITSGSGVRPSAFRVSIISHTFEDGKGTITFSGEVTSIGSRAFDYSSITSVTIPASVTSIGDYAFRYCAISTITIPASVTSIGGGAFANSGLTSVVCLADVPPVLGADVFYSVSKKCALSVPEASIPDYEAAEQWKNFFVGPLLVEPTSVSLDTTRLTWLPLDSAALYQLHIYSLEIALDTTIYIDGDAENGGIRAQGENSVSSRVHRVVMDDVGSIVVIAIDINSGMTSETPFVVTVSTTQADEVDIHYEMLVYDTESQILREEAGAFVLNEELAMAVESAEQMERCLDYLYDLLGRRYYTDQWDDLPAGIYIAPSANSLKKIYKR